MRNKKLMICAALMLVCFCGNSQITKAQICTGSAITVSQNTMDASASLNSTMSAISLPEMFDTDCLSEATENVLEDTDSGILIHVLSKMYAKSDVRIRSQKSTDSKIVDVLKFGKSITVLNYDPQKSWQEIEYKGKIRYICTDYLTKHKPKTINITNIKLHGLSTDQQKRAYTIAKVCIKEWKNYGVLPSVAIAQAMQESTLGKHCSGNNLWGICSGVVNYDSLESGVYGYLRVINNGCYGSAPFTKDASSQISKILAGGYCVPVGDYYNNVMWIINKYGLERFDKMI